MRITKNKKVAIVYQTLNGKGEILMEVSSHAPVYYLHGFSNNYIVPGLEAALEGHTEGDEFSVTLPFEAAYGAYNKKLVLEVAKEELTPFIDDFWVGGFIERINDIDYDDEDESDRWLREMEGESEPEGFVIREIRKNTVILDGNHPYAGMDLIFNVKVISVTDASVMELENGYPKETELDDDEDGDFYNGKY